MSKLNICTRVFVAFALIVLSSKISSAQFKMKGSPRFQSSIKGERGFFKRLEFQIGASYMEINSITRNSIFSIGEETKWAVTSNTNIGSVMPLVRFNFNMPLSQPDMHTVYGLGVGIGGEGVIPDFSYMMVDLPLYFYGRYGAEGSFDSRTRTSFGWGFGVEPYLISLGTDFNDIRLNNRVLGFLEYGKFNGTMWKFKLEGYFGNKDIYTNSSVYDQLFFKTIQSQTIYKRFPLRLSFVWYPFSGSWERNDWRK